jgi:hypothetical protein
MQQHPDRSAEGRGGTLGVFQEGIRDGISQLEALDHAGLGRKGRHGSWWQRGRLLGSRVVCEMGFGFARVVVVDRTVIVVMMMACGFQVLDFMRNVERIDCRQPPCLHGKAVQGKKHQQENTQEATHEDQFEKPDRHYSSRL